MTPGLTVSPNVAVDLATFWATVHPYALAVAFTAVGVLVRHLWPIAKPATPATPAGPGPAPATPSAPSVGDEVWQIVEEIYAAEKAALAKALAARLAGLPAQAQTSAPADAAAAPKS